MLKTISCFLFAVGVGASFSAFANADALGCAQTCDAEYNVCIMEQQSTPLGCMRMHRFCLAECPLGD